MRKMGGWSAVRLYGRSDRIAMLGHALAAARAVRNACPCRTGPPWQECAKLLNEDLQVWFHPMPFGRHFVIMVMLEGGVEAGLNMTAVRPPCSFSCPTPIMRVTGCVASLLPFVMWGTHMLFKTNLAEQPNPAATQAMWERCIQSGTVFRLALPCQ